MPCPPATTQSSIAGSELSAAKAVGAEASIEPRRSMLQKRNPPVNVAIVFFCPWVNETM